MEPNGNQDATIEPKVQKWSPRGINTAQEDQMEPKRLKWSPRCPNGAQEV
jgi:hypothetical protein